MPVVEPEAKTEQLGTLLVSCPDQKGIVAAVAQVLFGHGANILDSDQHTDPIAGMFFQRIYFDLSTVESNRVALEASLQDVQRRFGMQHRLVLGARTPRVAIFCSKQEHC